MSTASQAAKVVLNGEVILDVSNSTATETEVAQGYTFVKSTGEQAVGTLKTNIFQYEISSTSDYSSIDAVFEHIATLVSDGSVILRNGDYCIIEENAEPDSKITSYIYNQNSSTWLFVGTNTTSANIGRPGIAIGAEVFNNYDNNIAARDYAHAEGTSTNKATDILDIDQSSDYQIVEKWKESADTKFALANGIASHTEGKDNLALGNFSHAEGGRTIAGDSGAHAEGVYSQALGYASHSEGYTTTASGQGSHAEGEQVTAQGEVSHAEGNNTTACGDCSHAEGESQFSGVDYLVNSMGYSLDELQSLSTDAIQEAWSNTQFSWAHGQASHVEGKNNLALGNYSHAEGEQNIAEGTCAHTEGYTTTAKGDYAHAEGNNTIALGEASHAEGTDTQITANARYAHTEGKGTYANGDCQHAEGSYNKKDSFGEYIHIIGNGISDEERSNAHTVEWDGTGWFAGDVYVGSDSKTNKDDGSKKLATEEYVDQKISQSGGSGGGGSVDLSNYYTKDEVNNLIPDTAGFVTEHKMQTYVDQQMVQIGAMYETATGLTKDYNQLTLRDGRYYLIRQILIDSEQCRLSYSGLSFEFSELECVCMAGAAFDGYRYRSAGSESWTYADGNILPGSIVELGPGTIVQSFAITSLQEMNYPESTEES